MQIPYENKPLARFLERIPVFLVLMTFVLLVGCGDQPVAKEFKITSVKICSNDVSSFDQSKVSDKLRAGARYAIAEIVWENAPADCALDVSWYYTREEKLVQSTNEAAAPALGRKYFYLAFEKNSPLPVGTYKLEIKSKGLLLQAKSFTVE
jgi:hypothetical protein